MEFSAGKHLRPTMGILAGTSQLGFSAKRLPKTAGVPGRYLSWANPVLLALFAFSRMNKLRGTSGV